MPHTVKTTRGAYVGKGLKLESVQGKIERMNIMKENHTPGPWSQRYLTGYGYIIENEDKGQMQFGKLADIMPRGGGESKKNAELIAAAPELLEALQAIMYALEDGAAITTAGIEDMHHIAKEAIRKATGEA